jgi:hypothetical protein
MTDGGIVSPPDPAVARPIDHEREHRAFPTSAPPKQRRWSTAVGGNRPYVVSAPPGYAARARSHDTTDFAKPPPADQKRRRNRARSCADAW